MGLLSESGFFRFTDARVKAVCQAQYHLAHWIEVPIPRQNRLVSKRAGLKSWPCRPTMPDGGVAAYNGVLSNGHLSPIVQPRVSSAIGQTQ